MSNVQQHDDAADGMAIVTPRLPGQTPDPDPWVPITERTPAEQAEVADTLRAILALDSLSEPLRVRVTSAFTRLTYIQQAAL